MSTVRTTIVCYFLRNVFVCLFVLDCWNTGNDAELFVFTNIVEILARMLSYLYLPIFHHFEIHTYIYIVCEFMCFRFLYILCLLSGNISALLRKASLSVGLLWTFAGYWNCHSMLSHITNISLITAPSSKTDKSQKLP